VAKLAGCPALGGRRGSNKRAGGSRSPVVMASYIAINGNSSLAAITPHPTPGVCGLLLLVYVLKYESRPMVSVGGSVAS